ncbi:hypothetical protein HMPREF9123_2412 [Neisseria bacilliformis ATCC BAA-1200]|uniref:Uncharacterized protein n=1 Tax=Neisseria bacilliformis ATCC BAA-1200 TaxID=888742 RepID=F2BFA5_9NEIS|nr:hypothetical protein HMPREF9123_2412 [Neisseria bacilliformis ATCC BAA-1200]
MRPRVAGRGAAEYIVKAGWCKVPHRRRGRAAWAGRAFAARAAKLV